MCNLLVLWCGILAAAAADDSGFYYTMACNSILTSHRIKHELNVDIRMLFDTVATLHECREYRLWQTVHMIRNSFENGDLFLIRWIPSTDNVTDTLTKRS